jgi:hypothetical protein
MNMTDQHANGYFEIPRESPSISFESFWRKYVVTEQPCIIENIASNWKATHCWTECYLHKRLSEEPLAKAATLWYWLEKNALNDDYNTPEIIEKTINNQGVFPRTQLLRIWIHQQGNISSWHYDANMVNVFNAQVTGRKK